MIAVMVGFVFAASEGAQGPAGLDRDEEGRLVVWLALCPGEEVRSIEVTNDDDSLQWKIDGEGSTQERWVVGEPLPAGYRLVEASRDLSGQRGWVYADVQTSTSGASPAANQDQLGAAGITFEYGQISPDEFRAAALSSYPCDDPYGEDLKTIVVLTTLGLFPAFGALSLASLLWRR